MSILRLFCPVIVAVVLCLPIAGCNGGDPNSEELVPTSTATPTPDPLDTQVRDFTDPILQEVSSRAADYTDDFSSPETGWPIGEFVDHRTGLVHGESGYDQGEYFFLVRGSDSADEFLGVGGVSEAVPQPSSFVMRIDVRFVQAEFGGSDQTWQVFFRDSGATCYVIMVTPDGHMSLNKNDGASITNIDVRKPAALRHGAEVNSIQVVVHGERMAVLVNGEPGVYGTDSTYNAGRLRLNACNSAPTALRVQWDNVAIWNLAD
ncbi:MAG: hypothetical protein JXO72_01145 [Vicinamibacteria bacterium]|nr:hypothetical protein [Vicinamibacteria bacterium]